jgi:peptidoglycan/LPS O-acetylase OafA/YrhL
MRSELVSRVQDRHAGRLHYLDGLRAVAVVSVVAYHAGMLGFSGGYVGVDVFFVLSGFLIINQIWRQLQAKEFSAWEFYARRALRILPPYILVLLASIALASLFLVTMKETKAFTEELRASALMISNHLYLSQQGYFDSSADLKPLLHLWSLAVEEQFYIVAPAAVACVFWACRRGYVISGALSALLVCLASLAGAIALSGDEKNYGFYLAAFRAWEFAAGGAVWLLPAMLRRFPIRWPDWTAPCCGLIGAVAILGAVSCFSEETAYPSWLALVPVAGTVMIVASCVKRPRSRLARMLSTRPFVAVGLISYSWYLWHWPFLAFARIYRMGERSLAVDLTVACLAAAAAAATWVFVERPIWRGRERILRRVSSRTVVAGAVLACGIPLIGMQVAKTQVKHLMVPSSNEKEQIEAKLDRDVCVAGSERPLGEECLKELSGSRWGILMGDSFARTSYPNLSNLAHRSNIRLVTLYEPGCRPLLGTGLRRKGDVDRGCGNRLDQAIGTLARLERRPEFVVLRSYWHSDKRFLGGQDPLEEAARLETNLQRTLAGLGRLGASRILIVGTQPDHQRPPSCLVRVARGAGFLASCERSTSEVTAREEPVRSALYSAAARHPFARLVNPTDVFCGPTTCRFDIGSKPAYTDSAHLSQVGEDFMFDAYAAEFHWVLNGEVAAQLKQKNPGL